MQFDKRTGISACGCFRITRFQYDRSKPESYDWNLWEAKEVQLATGRARLFCRLRGGGTRAQVLELIKKIEGVKTTPQQDAVAEMRMMLK